MAEKDPRYSGSTSYSFPTIQPQPAAQLGGGETNTLNDNLHTKIKPPKPNPTKYNSKNQSASRHLWTLQEPECADGAGNAEELPAHEPETAPDGTYT